MSKQDWLMDLLGDAKRKVDELLTSKLHGIDKYMINTYVNEVQLKHRILIQDQKREQQQFPKYNALNNQLVPAVPEDYKPHHQQPQSTLNSLSRDYISQNSLLKISDMQKLAFTFWHSKELPPFVACCVDSMYQ